MSFEALQWAFPLELVGSQKAVLVALSWRANDDRICWPALDALARESGVCERSVRAAVNHLKGLGLISVKRGQRGLTYTVHIGAELVRSASGAVQKDGNAVSDRHVVPSDRHLLHSDRHVVPSDRHLLPPLREQTERQQQTGTEKPEAARPEKAVGSRAKARPQQPLALGLPPWVPLKAWEDFVEGRRQRKCAMTPKATELMLRNLEKLHHQGHDIGELLNRSTANGWRGVFAPTRPNDHMANGHHVLSARDQVLAGHLKALGLMDEVLEFAS